MGEAGTARCPDCGMSLDPNVVVGSSRVHVRRLEGGVVVELPWIRDLNGIGFLVSAALGLVPIYLLITDFWYGWPLALLMSPLAYGMLCTVLNRTTILVASGGVDISHGPLPTMSKAVTLTPQEARSLRLQRRETYTRRGGQMVTYDLAGPRGAISTYWNHSDGLDGALSVVERVLSFQRGSMGTVPMGYGMDNPLVPMGLALVAIVVMLGFHGTGFGASEQTVIDQFQLPDGVEFVALHGRPRQNSSARIEAVVQFTPEQWASYSPGSGFGPSEFRPFDLGRTRVDARPTAEALRWHTEGEPPSAFRMGWGWAHEHAVGDKPDVWHVQHKRWLCYGVKGDGADQRIDACSAFGHDDPPDLYVRGLLDEDDHRLFAYFRRR